VGGIVWWDVTWLVRGRGGLRVLGEKNVIQSFTEAV